METNKLKRFAIEARNILMQGVAHRFTALGFRPDGTPVEEPQLLGGGATFMGDTVTEDFFHKWQSLAAAIHRHGLKDVAEEAAYTWFNRLMAIRIMTKNGLIPPVLQYESPGVYVPLIVSEVRQGRLPQMNEEERSRLMPLLDDDSRTAEQFSLLITAFCHATPILHCCFGHIADYTELLLPVNILAEGGFVDLINHTDFIAEEDYRSSELIGWLYQFYIAEKKDEVFAAKGKFTASEIPAATQIFTPNWIVKYMVQNTVGRIYLDNNPGETEVAQGWKYLVPAPGPTANPSSPTLNDLTDLRLADLACGSGHILGEMFDMLYSLYINEGYSRREAIEHIFRHNLTGIDIDLRAKQLATFALLLKACQRDRSFADAHCMPRVLAMPAPYPDKDSLRDTLPHFLLGGNQAMVQELADAIALMDNADTLGSIMRFRISEQTRRAVSERMKEYRAEEKPAEPIRRLMPYMEIILALTERYSALVMNPPYMGGGNMNEVLSLYVKKNYEESKADLFSVFMTVCADRLQDGGRYGMINMQSWMFLSSFEKLRKGVLDRYQIDSMLHLGPHTFDELSGEVVQNTAFIISKHKATHGGTYFRLVDGKNCADKERLFLQALGEHTAKIYYPNVSQENFEKIPGCPIGYWVSEKIVQTFSLSFIGNEMTTREGMATADNDRFLRLWPEISIRNFSKFNSQSDKWYPYNKGGGFRRWFGNRDYVVNWEKNGYEIKNNVDKKTGRVRSHNYNGNFAFKECGTWSAISSGNFAIRYCENGFLWDSKGACGFSDNHLLYIIGFLNSNISAKYLEVIAPTLDFKVGDIIRIPLIIKAEKEIEKLVCNSICISKLDWDAHETSWDFRENELLRIAKGESYAFDGEKLCFDVVKGELSGDEMASLATSTLSDIYARYKEEWQQRFLQLHANEEELNRQFINIYGLEDELTPDVPLEEVTILQQGEISIEKSAYLTDNEGNRLIDNKGNRLTVKLEVPELEWHDDVVVKQLISYAVGCMMGRYRLDKPGLHIAHPEPTAEETAPYTFNGKQWNIDEDGILPLMPCDTDFADNATVMFKRWLVAAFGEDTLVDNLNFVEAALGKSLDEYFVKDFWKDHKKMCQNRPIYWLFASKKGAFQCLAYMHRMDAYTAERVRTKYLLPHIEWLVQKQTEMEVNAANLSVRERKQLDNITRQIAECREYHDRLHAVADEQIAFDLDDGVVVNYAKFGDVLAKLK